MALKQKYVTKTLNQKVCALKDLEKGLSNKYVAGKYKIPRNTLSTWVKNKRKLLEASQGGSNPKRQRLRSAENVNVDKAVLKWLLVKRHQSIPISGAIIQEKALYFARELGLPDFQASHGWLKRWKDRSNVIFKSVVGESNSVNSEMVAPWNETTLPTLLSNYNLKDIYNADEFGLFYQSLPDKSYHFKAEKCSGGKHSKIRLTVLAAANALGEKLPLVVVGKAKKPRCFIGVKHFPCTYRAQHKSWMTCELFDEWVRDLDKKFHFEGRKIVLIVDNCPAHPRIENLNAINLVFLPPNTTSVTQPMDQGVIRSLKAKYRHALIRMLLAALDAKKPLPNISILEAMRMLVLAWNKVSEITVMNCFKKAGICKVTQLQSINDDDDPFGGLEIDIEQLGQNIPYTVPDSVDANAFVDFDNEIIVTGGISDEDIIAEFREDDEDEEDGAIGFNDEPVLCPNRNDINSALDILQRYSLFCEDINVQNAVLSLTCKIDSQFHVKQGHITDFFSYAN